MLVEYKWVFTRKQNENNEIVWYIIEFFAMSDKQLIRPLP
jgi:hypothetical protein